MPIEVPYEQQQQQQAFANQVMPMQWMFLTTKLKRKLISNNIFYAYLYYIMYMYVATYMYVFNLYVVIF